MPQNFLQNHRLYLTPLSPLHLGTGEDYEPTNYVIENGVLYAFDPMQAKLTLEQRAALDQAVNDPCSLIAVRKYFYNHPAPYRQIAFRNINVAPDIATEYSEEIQRNKNALSIQRNAVNPLTGLAYIPGSAVKGTLRTTCLDKLNNQTKPITSDYINNNPSKGIDIAKLEKRLLQGDFSADMFRLLKISDFMPTHHDIVSRVQYAVNRRRDVKLYKGKQVENHALTVRRENICPAQYRAFSAYVSIQNLPEHISCIDKKGRDLLPKKAFRQPDLADLVRQNNQYHLTRWAQEYHLLDELNLADKKWLKETDLLLKNLTGELAQGRIMLVRLGKNTGAESKVLSGEGVAQILIKQTKANGGGEKPQDHTETLWLASEKEKSNTGLLPYGWALIEIDTKQEQVILKQWCENQGRWGVREISIKNEREAREAAERKEKEARATELAAMSPADSLIADWLEKIQKFVFNRNDQQAHTEFYQILQAALQNAQVEFSSSEQKQIGEALSFNIINSLKPGLFTVSNKREKEIKAILRQLRGEKAASTPRKSHEQAHPYQFFRKIQA